MKKLILSTAIILGGLTAVNAQTEKQPTAMSAQVEVADDVVPQTQQVQEQTLKAAANTEAIVQEYKEIKLADLPQKVKDAVATDMKGSKITKAYISETGDFKLELATADKKKVTAMATADGEWIKE